MGDERSANRRIKGIAAKVDAATLPQAVMGPSWATRGTGRVCSACDEPIGATEMELESVLSNGRTLHFHLECFTEWWKVTEARPKRAAE